MGHTLKNPVIGAIFLAWGRDEREKDGERQYVEQAYFGPPVEPIQTLFCYVFFFLVFFYFQANCHVEFLIFYFELPM